jgi:hypothetical protein
MRAQRAARGSGAHHDQSLPALHMAPKDKWHPEDNLPRIHSVRRPLRLSDSGGTQPAADSSGDPVSASLVTGGVPAAGSVPPAPADISG